MYRSVKKRGNADSELGKGKLEETEAAVSPAPEYYINAYAEASQSLGGVRQPLVAEPDPILDNNESQVCSSESGPVTDDLNRADNPPVEPTDNQSASADSWLHPSRAGVTPRLMTIDDVAAYCRMSKSKIARLEKRDPDFPGPIRIGGSTRWDRDAIDRYIDQMGLRNGEGS